MPHNILFLFFQPSTATNKAGIIRKKQPALDLAEFLQVCVLPHMKIVPEGHSKDDSVSCGLALALLRVALETPAMQQCDWTTVVRCRLFPTILCVCSVVDVCGCLYVDCTCENLYTVKEMAVELLGTLTRILNRQESSRMGASNITTQYHSSAFPLYLHVDKRNTYFRAYFFKMIKFFLTLCLRALGKQ